MESCFSIKENSIQLLVHVIPISSKTEIKEIYEGRLKIRIAAVPEHNKANEELRSFIAKTLGCAKKEVVINSGEKSRLKILCLPLELKEKLESVIYAHSKKTMKRI
jgi:uncharacterized protein (TIGR00251 family)